jgi:hypothetical protein
MNLVCRNVVNKVECPRFLSKRRFIMRLKMLSICCVALASLVGLAAPEASAAEKLSDILRRSKWDGIIGAWVDADTKGVAAKTTYAWKIKDRVIEITTKGANKETVALMGVNGKTGEVFLMGADSDGAASLGKWDTKDNGDAVLGTAFTSGDGQEGTLSIRHHLEDKDTMIVTVELPLPIKFKMIRVKR